METDPGISDTKCPFCIHIVNNVDQFCQNCGYPLNGTEEEQNKFISERNYKEAEVKELSRKTANAQTTLYVLSGLFFVFGAILYLINKDEEQAFAALITNLILSAIFLALGGWSKSKPVVAIVCGLVLYVLVQIIVIIEDPINIVKGILIKAIVIIYLVKGLLSSLEAERLKKELNIP